MRRSLILLVLSASALVSGLSIVGQPVTILTKHIVNASYTEDVVMVTMTVMCNSGETGLLEGIESGGAVDTIYIDCSTVTHTASRTLIGYVPQNISLVQVVAAVEAIFAESYDPTIIQDAYHLFMNANDQFQYRQGTSPTAQRRQATAKKRSISYDDWVSAATGVSGAAGVAAGGPLGAVFGLGLFPLISDTVVDSTSHTDFSTTFGMSGSSWANCNLFFSSSVGIDGLRDCIYQLVTVVNYDHTQINLLQSAVVTLQQTVALALQRINAIVGQVAAMQNTITQVAQQMQNIIKIQAQQSFVQQNTLNIEGGLASSLAQSATTQNTNNQNLLNIIGVTQQQNVNTQSQLLAKLNNLGSVVQSEIILTSRQILEQVAAQLQSNVQIANAQRIQDLLNQASANNQFTQEINTILQTISNNQVAINYQLSVAQDIIGALAQIVANDATTGALPFDVHNSLGAVAVRGRLPFVANIGTPPINLTEPTSLGQRNYSFTVAQIKSSITGAFRTCDTPYTSNAWQTALTSYIANTSVVTFKVPNSLDRNYPRFGDTILLQVDITGNGTWVNITNNPLICGSCSTSSCGGPNYGALCPNNATGPLSSSYTQFLVQSYDFYEQQNPIYCTTNAVNYTFNSCMFNTNVNNTVLYANCTATQGLCYIVLSGTNCSGVETNVLNRSLNGNMSCSTYQTYQCSFNLTTQVCVQEYTNTSFPVSNIVPGSRVYFGGIAPNIQSRMQAAVNSPITSNSLCMTEDSLVSILTSQVFTLHLQNRTAELLALVPALNSSTSFTLATQGQGPLALTGGCFTSTTSALGPSPAVFRMVSLPGTPYVEDEGTPLARRSVPTQSKTKARRQVYSPPNCPVMFNLVQDDTVINQASYSTCTAVEGCIIARIPRKDEIQLVNSIGQSTTLTPGLYELNQQTITQAIGFGTDTYFMLNGVALIPADLNMAQGIQYLGFNFTIPAGLRLHFIWTANGVASTPSTPGTPTTITELYVVNTVADSAWVYGGYLLPFTAPASQNYQLDGTYCDPSTCAYDWKTITLTLTVDQDPTFNFNYYEVCIPNLQPDFSLLTSNQCSFFSTKSLTTELPSLHNIQFFSATTCNFCQQTAFYGVSGYPQGQSDIFMFYPPGTPAPSYYSNFGIAGAGNHPASNDWAANPGCTTPTGTVGLVLVTASPTVLTNEYNIFANVGPGCTGHVVTVTGTVAYPPTWSATATSYTSPLSRTISQSVQVCYATCDQNLALADCKNEDSSWCAWTYSPSLGSNYCATRLVNETTTVSVANGTVTGNATLNGQTPTFAYCTNGVLQSLSIDVSLFYADCSPHIQHITYNAVSNPSCYPGFAVNTAPYVDAAHGGCDVATYFPSLTLTASNSPVLNSCLSSDIRSNFAYNYPGASLAGLSEARLCMSTLGFMYNTTSQSTFWASTFTADAPLYTGAFNASNPNYNAYNVFTTYSIVGAVPWCNFDFASGNCMNFDSQYSDIAQQYLTCDQRILHQNNDGACITSPAASAGGYNPRCVYILRQGTSVGECVPYMFDSYPTVIPGTGFGPYDMPAKDNSGQTISQICLAPGNTCYFEASPAFPQGSVSWYANANNGTLAYSCGAFSNDLLNCQLKTQISAINQCTDVGALCVQPCSSYNNQSTACANRLPYNTCYYQLATGICADNTITYDNLPVCANYQCASADTICRLYQYDEPSCVANSACIWYNYLFPNSTFLTCDAKVLTQNPACVENGVTLSVCNVTDSLGAFDSSQNSQLNCQVTDTTLTGNAYIQACVTLIDANSQQHCIYSTYGGAVSICTPPGSNEIASFDASYGTFIPRTSITFLQFYAPLAAQGWTYYTTTYNQLVATILKTNVVVTLGTLQNIGIQTINDDPNDFFACANSSYVPVWRYCCLATEVAANGGQCGPTSYVNPLSPQVLFQEIYETMCYNEAVLAGDTIEDVQIDLLMSMIGWQMPTPDNSEYALDSMYCPVLLNDTDSQILNYTISTFILADQALALNWHTRTGPYDCTIPFNGGLNETILMTRLAPLAMNYASTYFQTCIYNGTCYNLTEYRNIRSNPYNLGTDYTDLNITDYWTSLINLNNNMKDVLIAFYEIKSGSQDPRLWLTTLPIGGVLEDVYVHPSDPRYYGLTGKQFSYLTVNQGNFLPVYRVGPWNDDVQATIIVGTTNRGNLTFTPVNALTYDPNTNLLPQNGMAYTHAVVDDLGLVISPPYSSCNLCGIGGGGDWCTLIGNGPGATTFNYSDYVSWCAGFDPRNSYQNAQMFSSFCAHTPCDPNDPVGIVYGTDPSNSATFQTLIGLDEMKLFNYTDCMYHHSNLAWWNATISSAGPAATEQFVNGVRDIFSAQCVVPFRNFPDPTQTTYANDSSIVCTIDILQEIWIDQQYFISQNQSYSTALQNAFNVVLQPLIDTHTLAYCGNCGQDYNTLCLPVFSYGPKAAGLSAQNGLGLASQFYTISYPSSGTIQATAKSGSQEIIVTFTMPIPIAQLQGTNAFICPSLVPGQTSYFECDSSTGTMICLISAYNPLLGANIQVTGYATVTGDLGTSQQQTFSIGPQNNGSVIFAIFQYANTTLQLVAEDGTVCGQLSNVVSNITSIASATNALNNSLSQQITTTASSLTSDILALQNQINTQTTQQGTFQAFVLQNISTVYITSQNIQANFSALEQQIGSTFPTWNDTLTGLQGNFTALVNGVIQTLNNNVSFFGQAIIDNTRAISNITDNLNTVNSNVDNALTQMQNATSRFYEFLGSNAAQIFNDTNLLAGFISMFNTTIPQYFNQNQDQLNQSWNMGLAALVIACVCAAILIPNTVASVLYLYERVEARKKIAQVNPLDAIGSPTKAAGRSTAVKPSVHNRNSHF